MILQASKLRLPTHVYPGYILWPFLFHPKFPMEDTLTEVDPAGAGL